MKPIVMLALGIGAIVLLSKKQAAIPASNGEKPGTEKDQLSILIHVEWTPDAFGPPNYREDGTLRDEILAEGGFDMISLSREGQSEIFDTASNSVKYAEAIMLFLNSHSQAVESTGIVA